MIKNNQDNTNEVKKPSVAEMLKGGIKKKTTSTASDGTTSDGTEVIEQEVQPVQIAQVAKKDNTNIDPVVVHEEDNSFVTTSLTIGKKDLRVLKLNAKNEDEKPARIIRRLLREAGYFTEK